MQEEGMGPRGIKNLFRSISSDVENANEDYSWNVFIQRISLRHFKQEKIDVYISSGKSIFQMSHLKLILLSPNLDKANKDKEERAGVKTN